MEVRNLRKGLVLAEKKLLCFGLAPLGTESYTKGIHEGMIHICLD